jgi:hypothetical protein
MVGATQDDRGENGCRRYACRSIVRAWRLCKQGRYKQEPERGHHARADGRQVPVVRSEACGRRRKRLANVLQEHLHEEHALEMPRERVRENVAAQLKDFDGYNARPISGA